MVATSPVVRRSDLEHARYTETGVATGGKIQGCR